MNRHVLLLLATAILWSLGGVLIKSIDLAPVAIAGARSLIAMLIISLAMPGVLRRMTPQTIPGAIAYAATVFLFVVATKLTTAANAIFLQYTAPIYVAIISPWFLGERTKLYDWLLVLLALSGVALFFLDQLSLQGLSGVIAALGSGFAFAWLTVLLRRQRQESPEAVVLLGNLATFLVALPWMFPIARIEHNGPRLLLLGTVQLTIPYLLYSLAIRHVRALDASIISIIEPILNPIWVMLATSERPTFWSIVGGSIVLATSLTRSLLASRRSCQRQ
ncbi:MAG: DMT family transporter [Verrucomicrobia bacterium]|nr:DMT family transporter [Verrucomicrobiota bacterium]